MHKVFPTNLRRLVHHYPSTSRAAEALGINRQQLSKYLSGLSMPSLATLRNIAAHFELEPDDLLLPAERFAARWRPPMRIKGLPTQMQQVITALLQTQCRPAASSRGSVAAITSAPRCAATPTGSGAPIP
ncbi:helix-turn-helix transcriptional regulator [Roseobacter sp. TSBP12]|uniref:helix-turn-helix transcriptional regulator n=1 Tax=Roseobacter sp. TSBP12 TaxID=1236613 RepID=UPI001D02AE4B|nr:helix-turn-helix transcriptional regulator [Roseobacter sp. TSBP12]